MNTNLMCARDLRSGLYRWALCALGFSVYLSALADTTTLGVASASKGTSNTPVMLSFPVTRTGDISYDTLLSYHTIDGTAQAGIDYTAASGTIIVPAGSTNINIPITLAANTGNTANLTFDLNLDSATGIGLAPSFAAQQTFATGTFAYSVTSADINGDGLSDLIFTNFYDNTVSVLLNTTAPGATTPSFATQVTFATGSFPISVTTADINGDGLPDLVIANRSDNTVSVLLNATAPGAIIPSFATQTTFAAGPYPLSVTAADLNGDGVPDLITTNYTDNSVSVLINTTAPGANTPTFAAMQNFATGENPRAVVVADLNGDGVPDLVVANGLDNQLSVLLNTTAPGAATASFAAQQTFDTGTGPYSLATADINGDGLLDLIVANNGDNTVSVLLNTTEPGAAIPSFATQQILATGSAPFSVTATDLNGDGKVDIIVANSGDNTVSVLRNATAPGATTTTFTAQQVFAGGNMPASVTTSDVNGDGLADLIVTNLFDQTVSVLLNTTPASTATLDLSAPQSFATGTYCKSVTAADMNGDGKLDLIAVNQDETVSVLLNNTLPGSTAASFAAQQAFTTGDGPFSVATADINGDGRPDLIVANDVLGTVSVLLNTTEPGATLPSFASQQIFNVQPNSDAIAVADINGDGKPDLIVANASNSVSVLLNTTTTGAATVSFAAQQAFAAGSSPIAVTTADINGDGRPDLVVANHNDATVSVLLNTTSPGAAVPSFAVQQTFPAGDYPYSVAAADINGDGRPDLVLANFLDDTVSVLINTTASGASTAAFDQRQTFATGSKPQGVAITDLDGDGKPDVIVTNYNGATISLLRNTTLPGASIPSFSQQQIFASGPSPVSIVAADVNGDGKRDLIVANLVSDSSVSVLLNTQYQSTIAGSSAMGTIVHDLIFADGFE